MFNDLMVLIAVVSLGYTVSVMFMLAARDMHRKFLDLVWPKRCRWCDDRIEERYTFCSYRCRSLHHWDGIEVA